MPTRRGRLWGPGTQLTVDGFQVHNHARVPLFDEPGVGKLGVPAEPEGSMRGNP